LVVAALMVGCRADWPAAAGAAGDANEWSQAPAACSGRPASRELVVHLDGIHSGLRLPAADLPFDLQVPPPRADDGTRDWFPRLTRRDELVEVGFSDRAWFLHQDRSVAKVGRLLFAPDEGAITVTSAGERRPETDDDHAAAAVRPGRGREWRIRIAESDYQRLLAELLAWIDPEGAGFIALHDGARAECYSARFKYSLRSNCHDWTAHMLAVAGVPMPGRFHRTATRLAEDIDSVLVRD